MFAVKINEEVTYWTSEHLAVAHAQECEGAVEVFTPFGSLIYSQSPQVVEVVETHEETQVETQVEHTEPQGE